MGLATHRRRHSNAPRARGRDRTRRSRSGSCVSQASCRVKHFPRRAHCTLAVTCSRDPIVHAQRNGRYYPYAGGGPLHQGKRFFAPLVVRGIRDVLSTLLVIAPGQNRLQRYPTSHEDSSPMPIDIFEDLPNLSGDLECCSMSCKYSRDWRKRHECRCCKLLIQAPKRFPPWLEGIRQNLGACRASYGADPTLPGDFRRP